MYLCVYYCYIVFVNNYEFYWVSNKQTSTRKSITSVITDISINAGWFCLQWVNSTQSTHNHTSLLATELSSYSTTAELQLKWLSAISYSVRSSTFYSHVNTKLSYWHPSSLLQVNTRVYPQLTLARRFFLQRVALLCYISYIMKIQLKPITSWVRQFSRWWMGSDLAKIIVVLKESVCWSSN